MGREGNIAMLRNHLHHCLESDLGGKDNSNIIFLGIMRKWRGLLANNKKAATWWQTYKIVSDALHFKKDMDTALR